MKVKNRTYKTYLRWLSAAILGVVLLGLLFINVYHTKNEQIDKSEVATLLVNTARLQLENNYDVKRRFLGQVEATQHSQVGFELAGRIESLQVDEGAIVKRNDELARLDTKRLQAKRRELQARVAEIETRVSLANISLQRMEKALDYNGVSLQQVDEAKQQHDASIAALAVIQASVAVVDTEIEKSRLTAPFDAIVVDRQVDTGLVIDAGQPVMTLQQQKDWTARIGVAGSATEQFTIGDNIDVTIEGVSTKATVKSVSPVRNAITRVVDVILQLHTDTVRTGDLVEVMLQQKRSLPGYWIPLTALTEGERGTWTLLLADASGQQDTYRLSRYFVEILYQEADRAYIKQFDHEPDRYVANGLQRVVPGQLVRLGQNDDQFATKGRL